MLNGIDISSWQANIDLSKVPCDFVIVKATGGTNYINPYCDSKYQQAKKCGKLLGFYHYAHEVGSASTAIKEAEFFVKNTKNYFGEAIPVLDFEASTLIKNPKWALDFLNHVYKLTGVKPLFYTYTSVINGCDFSRIAKNDYGLWIANYGADNRLTGYLKPNPPKSNGFSSTAMFQYSSKTRLTGYNGDLDANVFYGDKNTWLKYVGKKEGNKVSYFNQKGTYKAKTNLTIMSEKEWKTKTGLMIPKGNEFQIVEVITGATGKSYHGKLPNNLGFVTLNKNYVDKLK